MGLSIPHCSTSVPLCGTIVGMSTHTPRAKVHEDGRVAFAGTEAPYWYIVSPDGWFTCTDDERDGPRSSIVGVSGPGWRDVALIDPFDLAQQAIDLFLENRDQHGMDEPAARASAALGLAEGCAATHQIAAAEREVGLR